MRDYPTQNGPIPTHGSAVATRSQCRTDLQSRLDTRVAIKNERVRDPALANPTSTPHIMPTISELFVYPIKSCAGIALNEARVLSTGLEYDRRWMAVDSNGAMLTQRAYPRMALIRVEIDAQDLVIRAPGMSELRTPLDAARLGTAASVETTVWRDAAYGLDTGEECAKWFSEISRHAGVSSRLIRSASALSIRLIRRVWVALRRISPTASRFS